MSSQEFFYSCISVSSMLLGTFLSKEASKILDTWMTLDFPVSVHNSNLLCVVGSFDCLCDWGIPLGSTKGFGSHFLGFVTVVL